jgi:hypothetical protein
MTTSSTTAKPGGLPSAMSEALVRCNKKFSEVIDKLAASPDTREVEVDKLEVALGGGGSDRFIRRRVIECLRAIEKIGAGRLIVGRRSSKSRFVPAYSLSEIVSAARGRTSNQSSIPIGSADAVSHLVEHRFVLRPNYVLCLSLPSDFTRSEAARLAKFIESLPFEPTTQKSD